MEQNKEMTLEEFNSMPVSKAVIKNAVPAMLAMLMFLVYNLADTFFISQTHDPYQIAAISLTTPLFMMFSAFGSIFGGGGLSVISRAAGKQDKEYIKRVSSFCTWGAIIVGLFMAVLFWGLGKPILYGLGASEDTYSYARTYVNIIAFCGPFIVVSGAFSKLLMADGQPKKAMTGMILGNVLNIVLDPILILALNLDIAGAALATLFSNVIATVYYLAYFAKGKSTLSISPKQFALKGVWGAVLAIGVPAALGPISMGVSFMFINSLMAQYGDMALAGLGIASKVTMITSMVCVGLGQGIQPLFGFSIGAKDWKRYKETLRFSAIFAFAVGLALTILCYIFTSQLIGLFLDQPDAYEYAFHFARVILTTSALFGVFSVLSNTLQAGGFAVSALIINLTRQGFIYVPALYILNYVAGIEGLAWTQPVADILSTVLVAFLAYRCFCKLVTDPKQQEKAAKAAEMPS